MNGSFPSALRATRTPRIQKQHFHLLTSRFLPDHWVPWGLSQPRQPRWEAEGRLGRRRAQDRGERSPVDYPGSRQCYQGFQKGWGHLGRAGGPTENRKRHHRQNDGVLNVQNLDLLMRIFHKNAVERGKRSLLSRRVMIYLDPVQYDAEQYHLHNYHNCLSHYFHQHQHLTYAENRLRHHVRSCDESFPEAFQKI